MDTRFATEAAKELDVKVVESIAEPEPHLVRKSVLKSAFVHGKHKVQVRETRLFRYPLSNTSRVAVVKVKCLKAETFKS